MSDDPFRPVEGIARALLYEGFLLFPYRAASLKNRIRTSFGELGPEGACAYRRSAQAAEIPIVGGAATRITARVAFWAPTAAPGGEWEAGREVVAVLGPWPLAALERDGIAAPVGEERIARLHLATRAVEGGLIVRCVLRHAGDPLASKVLHAAHVALRVEGGSFVSVVDPPQGLEGVAAACEPDGAWFFLAGPPGDGSLAIASPIILADHPAIAPESPCDLHDATENDELLALCIRALTDDERAAAAATDPRAAALLAVMDDFALEGLHGTVRSATAPGPGGSVRARVGDRWVGAGDDVVLAPRGRDSLDAALAGRRARVVEVLVEVGGREHLVVVVDDDPGRDLGETSSGLGHRFFVTPDEVVVAPRAEASP